MGKKSRSPSASAKRQDDPVQAKDGPDAAVDKSNAKPASRSQSRSQSPEKEDLQISDIVTFSDFVRHSRQLVRMVPSIVAADLITFCKAMAQAKYYDCDLVGEVWKALRQRIPRDELDFTALTEVISSLKELNAYDKTVFHLAARSAVTKVWFMSKDQRQLWTDAYLE